MVKPSENTVTCTASKGVATSTGFWSSPQPQCERITCVAEWLLASDYPRFEKVSCNNTRIDDDKYGSGTFCDFECKSKYYRKSGSPRVTCQPNGQWDDERAYCEVSKCPTIQRSSAHISVKATSTDCFNTQIEVGQQCSFQCDTGFKLTQQLIECIPGSLAVGKWSQDIDKNLPKCEDITDPVFERKDECNTGITIRKDTLEDQNYASINFDTIRATDNSGERPKMSCVTESNQPCEYKMGVDYKFGLDEQGKTSTTRIRFKATDAAGNSEVCRFKVVIQDKQKPKKLDCPDNIVNETSNADMQIFWKVPTYEDNCGKYPNCSIDVIPMEGPISGSKFAKKTETTIRYTARDPSGNLNEECTFTVKVNEKPVSNICPPLKAPVNGAVSYFRPFSLAQTYCHSGFYPEGKIAFLYVCVNNEWKDTSPANAPVPLPDCLSRTPVDMASMGFVMLLWFDGDCTKKAVQQSIIAKFAGNAGIPPNLQDGIQFHCGSTTLVNRRKRSTSKTISIRYKASTRTDVEKVKANPDQEIKKLKDDLTKKVVPNEINRMNNQRSWKFLNKGVGALQSVRSEGNVKEVCGGEGQVEGTQFDPRVPSSNILQKCVQCGAGFFKNVKTLQCEACPKGTYQPEAGQSTCLHCPQGSLVTDGDVKSFTSCKEICKPGEYSSNGLAPCSICPVGTYSDDYRSASCKSCPAGTTTVKPGTISKFDCGSTCSPGTYSGNGVEPCKPCPKGSYQPSRGETRCLDCPGLKSTASPGSSSSGSCMDIQDCHSNPCLNGANCVDLKDDYECQCPKGYWGHDCEKEVDECALQPCLNNATCIDKLNDYECKCLPGTGGRHCDQVVKRCTSSTCGTHATCVDLPEHKYKCVCDIGYTGEFCETKIDFCAAQPCKNDAFCRNVNGAEKYSCQCKPGFKGPNCETKISHCVNNPCKNQGRCIEQRNGFACVCAHGFEGLTCQIQTDMCKYKKCHNDGVCVSKVGEIKCLCAPGFSGPQCDTVENSDFDLSFQSRVSTSFSSVHGRKDLYHVTLAFWMRTSDDENFGTPISYAVRRPDGTVDDNAFFMNDYSSFNLGINNETESLHFDANDGEWHHIALTWSSSSGLWKTFKDGIHIDTATTPIQKGKFIPKGGIFVIGEEQDSLEGEFTPSESFIGDLSQLNIWDRELSVNEIYDLATMCGHEEGNVVAWSDFSSQKIGNVRKTTPSLACDFHHHLRDFQHLEDSTLPTSLQSHGNTMLRVSLPAQCAQECIQRKEWCRTFTYAPTQCNLYKGSILIAKIDPVTKDGTHLYSLSCTKPVGMSNGQIKDSQLTASSFNLGAKPHLARLNRGAIAGEMFSHWQPSPSDRNPHIRVNFNEEHTITGIATQGHYLPDKKEFATSYIVYYYQGGQWRRLKEYQANTDSTTVVRNELSFVASAVMLFPRRDHRSTAVAFRFELYGCPNRPQGTPKLKSDSDDCHSRPCQNGGRCFNLYRRYVCKCPYGFTGHQCQTKKSCDIGQLDLPVHGVTSSHSGGKASITCKNGYQTQGSSVANCVNSKWSVSAVKCVDIDECALKRCEGGCENSEGSYRCHCKKGYTLAADKRSCNNVNECSTGAGCQYGCKDIRGSFECLCPAGHRSKGARVCYDINECETGKHGCQHHCENTKGAYKCFCRPGYTLHSDRKSCVALTCPGLNNIANIQSISVKNNVATYTCKSGYRVNGPIKRYCLPGLFWSGRQPTCDPIRCNKLYRPEHGTITSNFGMTSYGITVRFACNSGYHLMGSNSRTCQNINNQAQWSGHQPYCIPNGCPKFTVINGQRLGLNIQKGGTARVQCNYGYKLLHPEHYQFRLCQSNGHWSGPGGNSAKVECKIMRCPSLPTTGGVSIKMTGGLNYQAIATYSCPANKCLNGNKVRRCQANGQWSGTQPSCLSNSCCKPPVPANSKSYDDGKYGVGEEVYVSCNKGYTLSGTELRQCQSNLRWSGQDPICTIKNCGDPGNLQNGVRKGDGNTTYGSTVRYFCDPRYIFSGSRERKCQADGTWSGTQPACTRGHRGGHIRQKAGRLTCNANENCHWLIQVTQGQKVNFKFARMTFFGKEDRADIYDGDKSWEPFVSFTKDMKPREMTSNGHLLRIISNGHVEIEFKESQCGGMLTEQRGVISSPNFPKKYPNNLNCVWTIHRPYEFVEMLFLEFLLQQNQVDNVYIYEGPFEGSKLLLSNGWGFRRQYLYDYADRWIWMQFKSDATIAESGFQAIWRRHQQR
eukprot:TCONS_00046199-protein